MISKQTWRLYKLFTFWGLMLIITGLYWYGASMQLTLVNTDMGRTDQSAYLLFARTIFESNFNFSGERNRMPVYPFIQSLFYHPKMTDEAFFESGKKINLILSVGLLAGITFIFRKFLSWLYSLNLLLIVAFTVFIFKAGYFQAELLFYFLNFCLFVLMWKLMKQLSWQLAILTGIIAGLAHLTKASILPGLVLFLVLATIKVGWEALCNRHASGFASPVKVILPQLLAIVSVWAFFLLTVFPYINTSKRVYGRYFYNVNSTFYIWYDSWEEAKEGTRAHNDRAGWPDMPAEEIPSMSRYLREHTLQQIIMRFVDGGQKVLNNMIHSYGYFRYLLIYMVLLFLAVAHSWRRAHQAVASNPILYAFIAFYFACYILLYAWYAPIVDGNRLILAQFIPLMFTISCGIQKLWNSSQLKIGGKSVAISMITSCAVLFVVIVDIYFSLTTRVGMMYGGA